MTFAIPQALSPVRWAPLASLLLSTLSLALFLTTPSQAEVRLVNAEGEYRMGDRDTRADAEHLALEAAKRNALEQVATYLESVTVVHNLDLTTDEIRTYTAGLLIILDQHSTARIEDNAIVIHVDLVAHVDSDEVVRAIAALRDNEDARRQVAALRTEIDQLYQELDDANARLAAATDPQQIQAMTQQRQDLLNQTRSNELLSQAWTDWTVGGGSIRVVPWLGYAPPQALIVQAWQLAPWNHHIQNAQRIIMPQAALPQAAIPSPTLTPSHARLQAVTRPWTVFVPGSRPARHGPRLSSMPPLPQPHIRPLAPRGHAPQGSGGRGGRRR